MPASISSSRSAVRSESAWRIFAIHSAASRARGPSASGTPTTSRSENPRRQRATAPRSSARVFVRVSGNQLDEYRWGGTSCGSRVLTEPQIAALQQALGNKRVRIQPLSQDGQGQTICLVGFTIVPKPDLALVLP